MTPTSVRLALALGLLLSAGLAQAQEPLPLPELPPIGAPPPPAAEPGGPEPLPLPDAMAPKPRDTNAPIETEGQRTAVPEAYRLDIPLEQIPNYRQEMRDIVSVLTRYAKQRDPRFIVVSGDGFGLFVRAQRESKLDEIKDPEGTVITNREPVGAAIRPYLIDFDAILVSGLYCGDRPNISTGLLNLLEGEGLMTMTAEHCADKIRMKEAEKLALEDGRLAHADTDMSARFNAPPTARPVEETSMNVFNLRNARSLLINTSPNGEYSGKGRWLHELAQTNYDVLVIDYFFGPGAPLTSEDVYQIKFKKLGTQRLVLAQLNIGEAIDTRHYWQREWTVGDPDWVDSRIAGRRGAYNVAYWRQGWKEIIGKSFAGIMDLGFDGIVLKGLDAYRWWEARTPLE